jgi:hypothetical protein
MHGDVANRADESAINVVEAAAAEAVAKVAAMVAVELAGM